MTLTEILTQVAAGKLSVAEAEALIRKGPPRPPIRRGGPIVVGLIFLLIGSLFALVGLGFGFYSWSSASGALRTEGTVIRMVSSGRSGSRAPVVHYEVNGQSYEFQSSVSSSPPAYSVGEKVVVLYHPDQPGNGRIDSFVELWLFPVIFGGGGSLFAVIGLVICLCRRKLSPVSPV